MLRVAAQDCAVAACAAREFVVAVTSVIHESVGPTVRGDDVVVSEEASGEVVVGGVADGFHAGVGVCGGGLSHVGEGAADELVAPRVVVEEKGGA